jgi:hypothetical protein
MEPGYGHSLSGSVNLALDVLGDHGLQLDPKLTLAAKAMVQAETITATPQPGLSIAGLGVNIASNCWRNISPEMSLLMPCNRNRR